jgi:lipid A disaccharide synthetase
VDACLVICLPFWSVQARILLRIREEDLVVLLMPASRPQELRHVWPVLASAARQLLDKVRQR